MGNTGSTEKQGKWVKTRESKNKKEWEKEWENRKHGKISDLQETFLSKIIHSNTLTDVKIIILARAVIFLDTFNLVFL